jgi:hypothetical protein
MPLGLIGMFIGYTLKTKSARRRTLETNWAQINSSGANFVFPVGKPAPLITCAEEK